MIDPASWHEVDRIFAEALDRPPAERPAFLDAACAGDSTLRRKVERLLAADAQGSGILERPPGERLRLALEDRELENQEQNGSLGPYRLLRRIGGGGMGAVYLARREDDEYRRDVAIKVLRSGLESSEALHRFLAERQILARLEHPNIARLYDGGRTEDDRPYLVMELVDGLPVDEYCDRHRLTIDQRLDLVQKICAAVEYAHQNLLVHRDLKPGNILITPEGEPKLLDFGIAKRLAPEPGDALQETRTGVRMLTPSYASPEQVRGDAITTASDVYSLGVILYELLAGRRPYQLPPERPYEIERAICEQEPERPSLALFRPEPPGAEEIADSRRTRIAALDRRLRGDLDNIVLMALRKEPQRRYSSVAQLSRDLERHLQDLPVAARPDTLQYRTQKLLRRHRVAAAATAAVVVLVAGFVASLLAQGRQLAQERDKARYALSFLVDTFKQADPYHTQGEELTAREILDQGTDRISRELAGQPDVQAAVMDAIGEVNLGLGRYDAAEPLLERALELRRRELPPDSREVAESLEHLAALKRERSATEQAESLLRQALAIRRRRQGDDDLAVARLLNQLGRVVLERKETSPQADSEAEALYREALAIARRVEGPEGLTAAETNFALSDLQMDRGNYAEAESLFREGLAIERKVLGDRDPRIYRDQARFGTALIESGKYKEAETVLRRCLEEQRKILGREHPDVAHTMNDLSMALHHQALFTEAEALKRELLALARSRYGPRHWRVAIVLGNLAADLHSQKRPREAIPYLEEALEIRRETLGENDPLVAQTFLLLAGVQRELENYPEGLRLAQQGLAILEKAEGPDHPHVAFALREIGRNYLAQLRYADAEPVLRRSLDIRRRKLEAGHPDLAKSQYLLAKCLLGLGGYDEAEGLLRESHASLIAVYGPSHRIVRDPENLMALLERLRREAPARTK